MPAADLPYVADQVAVVEAEDRVGGVLRLVRGDPHPVDQHVVHPAEGGPPAGREGRQEQDRRVVAGEDVGLGEDVPAQGRVAAQDDVDPLAQGGGCGLDLGADAPAECHGRRRVDRPRIGLQVDRVHAAQRLGQPVGVPAQQHADSAGGLGAGGIIVEYDRLRHVGPFPSARRAARPTPERLPCEPSGTRRTP
nr:hypothetical protein [Micromonospora sagamiensis]